MTEYVLRGGEAGAQRLRVLARVVWPGTQRLLRQVGLRPGLRCLDAGCGIGTVSLEMARQVAPVGSVVGIDRDEPALALARLEAERQGVPAVFRTESVFDLAEEPAFDLVYSRFLLAHLPDAPRAVERLARAARPGGVVVVEDVDFAGHFSYPSCPAFQRYVQLYQEVVQRGGGDACLGPRLLRLLGEAGLERLHQEVVLPAFTEGEGKDIARITLEHIRESVVASGLATHQEVDHLMAELDAFARQPWTILSLPRIFQVWGFTAAVELQQASLR
jgi:ubiquinone/menaquinone biosynthesis C-methylase UbiE